MHLNGYHMHDVLKIALSLMEELSCSRSLTISLLIRHGEWRQIAEMATDPLHYLDAKSYYDAACATDFLRKWEDLPTGINRSESTFLKWEEAEFACRKTNLRLEPYLDHHGTIRPPIGVRSIDDFVVRMQKWVRRIMGSVPDTLDPRFGPGATVSDSSRWCTIPDKITSLPSSTLHADVVRPLWEETAWARAQYDLHGGVWKIVRGNTYFEAPKDAKVNRPCAKGPSINAAYQAAIGRHLRARLRLFGIDLKRGQEIHRQVACLASLNGHMATIDLSSASDTVATTLVRLATTREWFDLLNWMREPLTNIPGKGWRFVEKFSAMGNGFTFELETILFASICLAAVESSTDTECITLGETCFVYGDDIIVPTEHADACISVLKWCGFSTNTRKTFLSGNFRESCGGDFWLGQAVRPYQLKKTPDKPSMWISVANGIRNANPSCLRTWFKVVDNVPTVARVYGPKDLGDIVIHEAETKWSMLTRASIRYVKVWAPKVYRKVYFSGFSYTVQMASALYPGAWRTSSRSSPFIVPRDGVMGYGIRMVPFS